MAEAVLPLRGDQFTFTGYSFNNFPDLHQAPGASSLIRAGQKSGKINGFGQNPLLLFHEAIPNIPVYVKLQPIIFYKFITNGG